SPRRAVAHAAPDAEGREEETKGREAVEHDGVETAAVQCPVERLLIGSEWRDRPANRLTDRSLGGGEGARRPVRDANEQRPGGVIELRLRHRAIDHRPMSPNELTS